MDAEPLQLFHTDPDEAKPFSVRIAPLAQERHEELPRPGSSMFCDEAGTTGLGLHTKWLWRMGRVARGTAGRREQDNGY